MIPRTCLLLLALWCAGCVGSTDLSQRAPYRPYVGGPVALGRPMVLVDRRSALSGYNGVRSLHAARYGLAEAGGSHVGPVFAHLPVGHRVTIDQVLFEYAGDNSYVVAYGRTQMPSSGETVSFACPSISASPPWVSSVEPIDHRH